MIGFIMLSPAVFAVEIWEENLIINQINAGGTIFWGEKNLDLSNCMESGGITYHYVINNETGTLFSISVPNEKQFDAPISVPGWALPDLPLYLSNDGQTYVGGDANKILAFTLKAPSAKLAIIDTTGIGANDIFYRGQYLKYRIVSNLDEITSRLDYGPGNRYDNNFNIITTDPNGVVLTELMTFDTISQQFALLPSIQLDVSTPVWNWPEKNSTGWLTDWRITNTGQESDFKYPIGTYTAYGMVGLNGITIRTTDYRFQLQPLALTLFIDEDLDKVLDNKRRDVGFVARITGLVQHRHQILIYQQCPPKMTGKICDRPPYIYGSRPELVDMGIFLDTPDPVDGYYPIGGKQALEMCKDDTTIRQAVPSGDEFPSKGDWNIFEDGTRYYADLSLKPCIFSGCIEVPFFIDKTVKPGTYIIQVQDEITGQVVTDTIDVKDPALSDAITVEVKDRNGNSGPFSINDKLVVSGTNRDSNTTYIWLTGPGLPPCGVNLRNIDSDSPEIIKMTEIVVPGKKNARPNWNLIPDWETNSTPIGPGEYTLWVASGNPDDQGFCQCNADGCGTCNLDDCFGKACENGVCALEECPHCLAVTSVKIIFKEPELNVDPIESTERCCCDGSSCGKLGGVNEIIVRGNSTGNDNKEVRFWLFGPGQFGQKNYLVNQVPVYCDCDYIDRFEYDLNRYLFQENGIDLCEITPGTYDLLVQAPGSNGKFDIRLGDKGPTGDRFVLTTLPTDDSRSFLIEGKDALFSQQALKSLKQAFDVPGIDDLYVHKQFVISDKPCDDTIDFSADRTMGNAPLIVKFTDLSKIDAIQRYWYANDELIGTQTGSLDKSFIYTFEKPGKYRIRLDLIDSSGKTTTLKKNWYINVLHSPVADFSYTPDPGKEGEPVQFFDESQSSQSSGGPSSWMWNFGDGNTSSLQSPVHIYTVGDTDKEFPVTLTIGNAYGVGTSVTKYVKIKSANPAPVPTPKETVIADFSGVRVGYKTFKFTDLSKGDIISWTWDFMDGVISHERNPVHEFLYPNRYYTVTLTVKTASKLESVKQLTFYVE